MQCSLNAAWSRGLGTVINSQGIMQSPVVREHAGIADDQVIMKSIALGRQDESFPANAVVSERKSVDEAAVFVGFGDDARQGTHIFRAPRPPAKRLRPSFRDPGGLWPLEAVKRSFASLGFAWAYWQVSARGGRSTWVKSNAPCVLTLMDVAART